MTGIAKLLTASGGGIKLQAKTTIAADVEVNIPSVAGDLVNTGSTGQVTEAMLDATLAAKISLTRGTTVNSTSGTAIDFTGIPSWAKRITVMFNGVSTTGTSLVQVQLGDSGGIENTGYVSYANYGGGANASGGASSTTGFLLNNGGAAVEIRYGTMTISSMSGNLWIASSSGGMIQTAAIYGFSGGGAKTLSDVLDRIRITTVNGTDTFDAGSINIMYE